MNCVPVVIVDLTNKAYILYMIFDDWLTWTSYLKICLMGESRPAIGTKLSLWMSECNECASTFSSQHRVDQS